jgi:hypothetical protein
LGFIKLVLNLREQGFTDHISIINLEDEFCQSFHILSLIIVCPASRKAISPDETTIIRP